MFGQMTQQEREAALEAARLAQQEKAAFNKENEYKYKLTYLDAAHWEDLRTKYKIRFPTYNVPADAKGIRKYLKKLKIDNDTFKEHYTSVEYFLKNNPKWTMFGVCGLLLEMKEGCDG